jgi:hypothetical protein
MRVVLAMSGGVDSSAAAVLLKQQGYDVIGLFMRSGVVEETACRIEPTAIANPTGAATTSTATLPTLPIISTKANKQGCCSASDAADARRVADLLDIPFHALNFQDAFGRIKDYFVDEYLSGRTPNPCVMCNNWLKFGKLWDFAVSVGADRIEPDTMPRSNPSLGAPRLSADAIDQRTSPTSSLESIAQFSTASCFLWVDTISPRFASWRPKRDCGWQPNPIVRRSVLSPTTTTSDS